MNMKAFWWFRENSIAGMARPGFNFVHWFELPFDEAILLGWLGRFSGGVESFDAFEGHLRDYVPKIRRFYPLSDQDFEAAVGRLRDPAGFEVVLGRLARRTRIFDDYEV